MENPENLQEKDEDNLEENKPPPVRGQTYTQQNVVECRDQLTMRKDNYAYFVTTDGSPRDNGSRALSKRSILPKFGHLEKGLAKEIRKGHQYHLALPIEADSIENLSDTLNSIKLSILSLHSISTKLKLRSISIAKTSQVNHIGWKEIREILISTFSDSSTKIII